MRHLPGDDPRRQDRGLLHLARQAWPPACATSIRRAASRCRLRRLRRRSHDLPHGLQRSALWRVRVRPRRRHARQADRGDQGSALPACPFRPMPRSCIEGFVQPGQRAHRRARSANGPAITQATCAPEPVLDVKAIYYRNNPDPAGLRAAAPARRALRAIARCCARLCCARASSRRACRRDCRLGARGRQRAAPPRHFDQPALSRPCQAGRPYRGHVPCGRLLRPLCDRGR